jgi:hypothetical protein
MKALALLLALLGTPQEEETAKPVSAPGFLANFQHAFGRPFPGPWQPYVLDLDNSLGRDLEVRIRIEEELSRTVVTRKETLPNQSRRRVFVYVPVGSAGGYSGAMQPKFKVTDAAGRTLASGILPATGRGWGEPPFSVGLLSGGDAASDRAFGLPSQSGGSQVEVGRFTPATFPDRWIGLTVLDALVLHDPPLDQFTPDQGRALLDWVRQGGTLFLSPGKNRGIYTHDLVKSLATLRTGEPEVRDSLPKLSSMCGPFREKKDFVYQRIENGGAEFLKEAGGEVPDFPVGYGRLVALRFNVREAPFDTWPGLEAFWRALFDRVPRRHRLEEMPLSPVARWEERFRIFQELASFVNPYPSFALLLGITVLFIVAVGPANYLVLRRLRMTLLTVVSVPVVSALFLGLILGLGYVLKGTSTVVHSVRYLHGREGLDCARETHLYSIFSPSTRTYDVSFAPGAFGLPSERLLWDDDGRMRFQEREHDRLEVEQDGPGLAFRGMGVGQWRSRHVESRSVVDLGGAVSFEFDGGTLRVKNGTRRAIARGVHLRVGRGGASVPFGAVPPGGSVEVQAVPAPYDPLRDLGFGPKSLPHVLFTDYFQRLPQLFQSERVERQREFLVCLLENDPSPPVAVDARLSSESRTLTFLQVGEDRR